mgnify:CR=1 FL=1
MLNLLYAMFLFALVHVMVWWSINLQFVNEAWKSKSLFVTLVLSIPISLASWYAARVTYDALDETAWGVRFLSFGVSYLVFPFLTWMLLKESMLTPKTLVCFGLSLLIIGIQIFWR